MARFKLLLLRHGNTFHSHETPYQVGAKTDLPLTETGIAQAHAFVDYLHRENIAPTHIFSGALQRQTATAGIIHSAFQEAALTTHTPAFDEIDYGVWEKLTVDDIQALWPEEHHAWDKQGVWPESLFQRSPSYHVDLLQRWLADVAKNTPDNSTVVAVSSNGIIRLFLQLIPNHTIQASKVSTGAFCALRVENGVANVEAWNCRA